MKTKPFWLSDPAHAWLSVNKADYPDAIESATGHGYETRVNVYLEEDVEAVDFLNKHPELDPESFEDIYTEVDIRTSGAPRNPRNLTFDQFVAKWFPEGSRL